MENLYVRIVQCLSPSCNESFPLEIRADITANNCSAIALVCTTVIEIGA